MLKSLSSINLEIMEVYIYAIQIRIKPIGMEHLEVHDRVRVLLLLRHHRYQLL